MLIIPEEQMKNNIIQNELISELENPYLENTFDNIPELLLEIGAERLIDIIPQLIQLGILNTNSDLIRLIRQDNVKINNEKIFEDELDRVLMNDELLQIGTKRFLRIIK